MKLKDKIAIVTGGAMGNGLGIVKIFLKHGAKVSIFDYSEKLQNTVDTLKSEGYDVDGYSVDIRDSGQIKNAIDKIIAKYNKIDILVNNAGVAKLTPFLETPDEIRDFHFDINIKGTWNVSKAVVPYMSSGSSIVNLSSVTGTMVADTGEVAYATTKAAVDGIAKGIPMKRLGTIEELGEFAAFLASDEASYLTGQGYVIDGGSTLPETMSVGV